MDCGRMESPNSQALVYQTVMNDTKQALIAFEKRFRVLTQQQFIFVTALDRCRRQNFEPSRHISTIAQVQSYHDEVADNATDKRIFAMFLALVYDLAEFRRALERMLVKGDDERVKQVFHLWKKILHPRQDISGVRAHYPDDQINHLSCDEARNHFGGIVSLIPVTMGYAREIVARMESSSYFFDDGSAKLCLTGKFKPKVRMPSGGAPRSRPTPAKHDNKDGGCLQHLATPVLKRPSSSNASGRSTPVTRTASNASLRAAPRSALRPRTADVTLYANHAAQTSDSPRCVQRPATAGKATQTPNCLYSALQPALDWEHRTVSEQEMRRYMQRKRNDFSKPSWRP